MLESHLHHPPAPTMSSERHPPNDKGTRENYTSRKKRAVHERDRNSCVCCGRSASVVEKLDLDYAVPRGVGGSESFSNLLTLCRQCHDAKHGEGLAPTVEMASTGRMEPIEFDYFTQFMNEMLPALAEISGVDLDPKFNLDGREAWHLPLGDLRRLDKVLSEELDDYCSFQAADYM